MGSCMAVYNYICDNYPDIMADVYLETIPDKFMFLQECEYIRHIRETDGKKEYDLFIALDCGDAGRLGMAGQYFEVAKVHFVLIIISVTSPLPILIIFSQMQVLPVNWFISFWIAAR